MTEVNFFDPKGPFYLDELLVDVPLQDKKIKIYDIKTLDRASKKDITFFNSLNYKSSASKTKASVCITLNNLKDFLPKKCIKVVVKNVLFSTAKVSKLFYPDADLDYPDKSLVDSKNISSKKLNNSHSISSSITIFQIPLNQFLNKLHNFLNNNSTYHVSINCIYFQGIICITK